MATAPVGYLALLRTNRNFRRLWYGQIVSQLGDWLDSIALFALTLSLTGSGQAVGLLLVAEFLPGAIVGPFAGVIIDRLPRKLVLIAADIGRALLVLALLLVQDAGDLWLLYGAVAAKVALSAFFEPARSAIIPSLCTRDELVAANAISGATWSAVLAIGAAIGGFVAGTLGYQAAFLLDAATFLLSAVLIATVRAPAADSERGGRGQAQPAATPVVAQVLGELLDGLRFIWGRPLVFWLTLTKFFWSLGAGVLLLLAIFGRELFPLGRDGAFSIGLLYMARGIGTGIGPIVALRLGGSGPDFLRHSIAPAILSTGLGYILFSGAPNLGLAMLTVLLAHIGGSIQWVFSTALLQMQVPDQLRGRVFAIEYAALTLATALSSYLTGVARDAGADPRALALGLAGIFIASSVVIGLALRRHR